MEHLDPDTKEAVEGILSLSTLKVLPTLEVSSAASYGSYSATSPASDMSTIEEFESECPPLTTSALKNAKDSPKIVERLGTFTGPSLVRNNLSRKNVGLQLTPASAEKRDYICLSGADTDTEVDTSVSVFNNEVQDKHIEKAKSTKLNILGCGSSETKYNGETSKNVEQNPVLSGKLARTVFIYTVKNSRRIGITIPKRHIDMNFISLTEPLARDASKATDASSKNN